MLTVKNYLLQLTWGVISIALAPLVAWMVLVPMLLMGVDNRYTAIPSLVLYIAVATAFVGLGMKKLQSKHPHIHAFAIVVAGTISANYFVNPYKRPYAIAILLLVVLLMPIIVKLIPNFKVPKQFKKLRKIKSFRSKHLPNFSKHFSDPKNWFLLVVLGIPILFGSSYYLDQINRSQDATRFAQMQRDIKAIYEEAQQIDSRATYHEYCSKDTGLYSGGKPESCGFSVRVQDIKKTGEFETLIEKTPYFAIDTFTYERTSELISSPRFLQATVSHSRLAGEDCSYYINIQQNDMQFSCKIPAVALYITR